MGVVTMLEIFNQSELNNRYSPIFEVMNEDVANMLSVISLDNRYGERIGEIKALERKWNEGRDLTIRYSSCGYVYWDDFCELVRIYNLIKYEQYQDAIQAWTQMKTQLRETIKPWIGKNIPRTFRAKWQHAVEISDELDAFM